MGQAEAASLSVEQNVRFCLKDIEFIQLLFSSAIFCVVMVTDLTLVPMTSVMC